MKTHKTAVVLVPPIDFWPRIQAIRREYDSHFRRWMPHITLIYPFRRRPEFAALAARFSALCEGIEPFRVALADFRYFRHRQGQFTLWLAPEPTEPLIHLHKLLAGVVPDCDEVTRHQSGFAPHLSVGQVRGEAAASHLRQALQAAWRPISFMACEISLIWRGDPPDDVFRVSQTVSLGRQRYRSMCRSSVRPRRTAGS